MCIQRKGDIKHHGCLQGCVSEHPARTLLSYYSLTDMNDPPAIDIATICGSTSRKVEIPPDLAPPPKSTPHRLVIQSHPASSTSDTPNRHIPSFHHAFYVRLVSVADVFTKETGERETLVPRLISAECSSTLNLIGHPSLEPEPYEFFVFLLIFQNV